MNVYPHAAAVATAEPEVVVEYRAGRPDDAPVIEALINTYREEGHLLPRQQDEIRSRATRFVVAEVAGEIKACAELVPLSPRMAEVRSLVVAADMRRHGLATHLTDELRRRALSDGFRSLLALAHDPRFFMRHNFSIVPHEWLSEKIARDCSSCALFQQCGQHAMLLPLLPTRREGASPVRLRAAAVA
jgi:amino-acid N-acetyltransferase